jgi:hypothetical protein
MPAMLNRIALLAASALMGAGMSVAIAPQGGDWPSARALSAASTTPKHGNKAPASPEQRAAWLRVRSNRAASRRFGGLGWPVATDRRMARKRRNVIKARRAKRG